MLTVTSLRAHILSARLNVCTAVVLWWYCIDAHRTERRLCRNGFVAAAASCFFSFIFMACDFGTVCVLRYALRSWQQIFYHIASGWWFLMCDLLHENRITFCNHSIYCSSKPMELMFWSIEIYLFLFTFDWMATTDATDRLRHSVNIYLPYYFYWIECRKRINDVVLNVYLRYYRLEWRSNWISIKQLSIENRQPEENFAINSWFQDAIRFLHFNYNRG